ncbi:MAG: NAD(P)/FAD-dependent oxidoreductase [Lachnospiraceae bacterium]
MVDVTIIGAGIIGSFLAHDLSKYQLRVLVLEKDSDVANEASMANSAIVHAGHDPKDGTLKAKLNVRGNRMYETVCRDLGVSYQRTSAFVVSTSKEENLILEQLYKQASDRQIPVSFLTGAEAIAKEKNLSETVIRAIELPTTAIIYPWEVAIALMEEAVLNDVTVCLNQEVRMITKSDLYYEIHTQNQTYQSRYIINAAGVHADDIYRMVSPKHAFRIIPRKGEYYVLDRLPEPLVQRVIYPVPSALGKGVLVVPTIHGNLLLGPNSSITTQKDEKNTTKEALDYVRREVSKTVRNIPMNQVIRTFAGLRPTGESGDFVIEEAQDAEHFVNVACIESPGIASAPAISEYVLTDILMKQLSMIKKETYQRRTPILDCKNLSQTERKELVKRDKTYANVICRCEQITEGEILDAIRRPLGAKSVKGVKKRVRPGMGRCQGGFCEPRVIDILARELGISALDILLDGEHSTLLMAETKEEGCISSESV